MTKFDKKIKELSRNIEIPKGYSERVDNVLKTLPERNHSLHIKRKWSVQRIVAFAVCVMFVICILSIGTIKTDANVFSVLKMSIMDFLYGEDKDSVGETGVKSHKTYVKSKQDLVIELKETVIDKQNLYLMVQVTAPPDIELNEDISFDYVALCKGENFSVDNLLVGTISCTFLESMRGKPNIATYVLSMLSSEDFVDGENLTAHFRDLKRNPNEPEPEMLVEGTWSIAFTSNLTTRKELSVEGTPDMTYPCAGTIATLKELRITPLGMAVTSDISLAAFDELGVMDTTIAIRLKMLDGSEHNMEEDGFIENASSHYDNAEDGKNYQIDKYEFQEAMDISKIAGVYIEDLYVPMGVD